MQGDGDAQKSDSDDELVEDIWEILSDEMEEDMKLEVKEYRDITGNSDPE